MNLQLMFNTPKLILQELVSNIKTNLVKEDSSEHESLWISGKYASVLVEYSRLFLFCL